MVNEKKKAILIIFGSRCLEEGTKGINPGIYRLLFFHLIVAIAIHNLWGLSYTLCLTDTAQELIPPLFNVRAPGLPNILGQWLPQFNYA